MPRPATPPLRDADFARRGTARTRRPLALAILELASLIAFTALFGALLAGLVAATGSPSALLLALAGAFLGVLAADFGTGLVHFLGDRLFEEETPVVGPLLIRPFREHHVDPLAITRHGFLETNGSSALLLAIALALGLALLPHEGALGPFAHGFAIAFALAAFAANQLHKWAHAPRAPRAIAWLQARRLVLSPAAHALHHRADHSRAYCVATGWLNPPLDRLAFFARLERRARE